MKTRREFLAVGSVSFALSSLSPLRGEEKRNAKLLLYGGGRPYEPSVLDTFFQLAGGVGAKFVVIPTAHEEMDREQTRASRIELVSRPWRERGAHSVTSLHTLDRLAANDDSFLAPLREADAIWFGGGDQSRLLNTYRDTKFHRLLLEKLRAGCAVGGSSAGTAVQSQWTIIGVRGDEPILEPGLGLLTKTIVDQHFLARRREPRLLSAVKAHEGQFGLGIDEFTAAVFSSGKLSAVGKSSLTLISPTGTIRSLREGDTLDSEPLGLV